MTLKERIDEALKEALKMGDTTRVSVLRLLKAQIRNREIEKRRDLGEDEVLEVIAAAAKQRREAIEQFQKGGREDLVQKEQRELEILEGFLPEPLSEEALDQEIRAVIQEVGALGPRDMGKVMKVLMPRVRARAEGSRVQARVRELLSRVGEG